MAGVLADIGGDIRVTLTVDRGRVVRVAVANSRPVGATSVFHGHDAAALPGEVGRLYSLCGRAQTIAALGAVEDAMGIAAPPPVIAAREAMRLSEMLTQTAMRLALHWPVALGLDPDPGPVRVALLAEQALAAGFGGWTVPGAGLDRAAIPDAVDRADEAIAAFLQNDRLSAELTARGLGGFGALPEGTPPEQGALTRMWKAPEVAAARARHGAGLATRLTASLAELAMLPGQVQQALTQVGPAPEQSPTRTTGRGTAQVETARGTLIHRLDLENGGVVAYRIDAPTEVNFVPGGALESGLLGAPEKDLDIAARLHILAIDPCVGFTLEREHA